MTDRAAAKPRARTLSLAQITRLRATPGATALLYLTDRCPVGCAHCSVASTPHSPGPPRHRAEPLAEMITALCDDPQLRTVAVSGGEPFAQRRALTDAVARLHTAGKSVVVFTSGFWARPAHQPAWIGEVLERCAATVLGADSFHAARLGAGTLAAAVRAVTRSGSRPILQFVDEPGAVAAAEQLLHTVLGPHWRRSADVHPTPALTTGRGADVFAAPPARALRTFGPCHPLNSPTLRYDGVVTACCNEAVITGSGPDALRRAAADHHAATAALDDLRRTPLLRIMAARGPRALESVPGFESLAAARFGTVCEACWAAHEIVAGDPAAARYATAVSTLIGRTR